MSNTPTDPMTQKEKLLTHLRALFSDDLAIKKYHDEVTEWDRVEYRHLLLALRYEDTGVAQCILYPDGTMTVTPDESSKNPYHIALDLTRPLTDIDESTAEQLCKILGI